MAVFDRDPALERRQIQEISANVARRLLDVLDRSRHAEGALRAEIEEAVAVITGIQRDVDQIVTGMPGDEALDVAILTHILGGQQHALERLEDLEAKLRGSRPLPAPPDPERTHAALIATAREIEREALRHGTARLPAPPQQAFSGSIASGPAPPYPAPPARPAPSPQTGRPRQLSSSRPPQPDPKPARRRLPGIDLRALAATPRAAIALGTCALASLAVAGWALMPAGPTETEMAVEQSGSSVPRAEPPTSLTRTLAAVPPAGLAMEQPYLVVLATRRTTEELQHDYRAFKQTYADLLAGSKARVDRIQGQDRQTYYRLSLIPPQTRAEARALCGRLRQAGLSGCWIRQVPVN